MMEAVFNQEGMVSRDREMLTILVRSKEFVSKSRVLCLATMALLFHFFPLKSYG